MIGIEEFRIVRSLKVLSLVGNPSIPPSSSPLIFNALHIERLKLVEGGSFQSRESIALHKLANGDEMAAREVLRKSTIAGLKDSEEELSTFIKNRGRKQKAEKLKRAQSSKLLLLG